MTAVLQHLLGAPVSFAAALYAGSVVAATVVSLLARSPERRGEARRSLSLLTRSPRYEEARPRTDDRGR